MFTIRSEYSYTGDNADTLNSLTKTAVKPNSTVSVNSLHTLLLPDSKGVANPSNQNLFMAMPMSWWVSSLTSGAINPSDTSNTTKHNWVYTNASTAYNIDASVSTKLIPDTFHSSLRDSSGTIVTHFEPKFGMNRTDYRSRLRNNTIRL